MEQIDDGRDGLVAQGCHLEMAVKHTGHLLIPLENVACMSGDLSAVRLIIYSYQLPQNTPKHHPFTRLSDKNALLLLCLWYAT